MLNRCLANEAYYIEENSKLVTTVESQRSELDASVAQNRVLKDSNSVMVVQLEEYKKRAATLEVSFFKDKNEYALEVEQLKCMLVNSEEEISNLMRSKEELEITVIVLKAKLDEQLAHITSLEKYNDELMMLQNQCNELSHRLSQQILKTEEFKNLSIHLKELKDKADAECLQTREKREPEGPSVAMQDSLRIAFIKEQYETSLQVLRHQLSISKKHGEEMLLKLQDTIDEIENRKKSEASHLKRNEELSLKILELEAELHSVVSDKRGKIKAYDRIKAELECALLSLECCKDEKQKLEAALQECDAENSRIAVELTLTKGQLESSASPTNVQKEENGGSDKVGPMSRKPVIEKAHQENPIEDTPGLERITADITGNGSGGNPFPKYLDQYSSLNCDEVDGASSILTGEGEHSSVLMNLQPIQDVLVSKGVHGIPKHALLDQEALTHSDSVHLAVISDHFKARSLKSSMDHLHEELERMKNENSLLLQNDHHFDPNFEGLQRELMQLNKANEDLGSMFPLFNEFSSSGNALERVLALEIELAEALQAKKKSSIHFQSSFLKQHSDEEAVFQSFRDINELIKDMLELKGRYAAVDSELKEMHDRYSQLSLQFAEVEGERQKLMMTLKNVRASKKLTHLNRSSSATLGDHPS
uniref:Putative centromere-associated protein E n=1 Tax=Davidia involucrata TaxID=16924 RepID=A0A5B6ZDE6_DAVIN